MIESIRPGRQFTHAKERLLVAEQTYRTAGIHEQPTREGGVLVDFALLSGMRRVVFGLYQETQREY